MRNLRSLPLFVVACAVVCSTASMGQQAAATVRIVDRIDESHLVTLKGNTLPVASAKNDRGRVSDNLPMTDLILVLSRDPAQQAAFEKFVASQYDSASPNFHQWLTPDEVGANFGPAETDIATVTNWLTGHGFAVSQVTKDRMSIRFSGTAGQVTNAFHTEIHNLEVKGVAHIGNMSDPQIPASLSSVVVGVKSLHNFFPRPLHRMGSQVSKDKATGLWKRMPANATTGAASAGTAPESALGSGAKTLGSGAKTGAAAKPQFTINVPGQYPYLVEDVGPWDFAAIYNVAPLWSSGIDGSGQTIAIAATSDICVGQSDPACETTTTSGVYNNDIATFRTFFGLPTNAVNTPKRISGNSQPLTVCTDTTGVIPYPTAPCNIDDLIENSLDVEWSGSVAKNAQIVLVASYPASATDDNLYDSESYIVNNVDTLNARIMNVSYGECELFLGTAGNVQYYNLWQMAASEGIAVFVAAGDSGSAGCDAGGDGGGAYLPYAAEFGLTVSGIASTPWNTAVGGTDFNWCPVDTAFNTICTAGPYWSTSNNTSQASALGYLPEVPWNDTCSNPLALTFLQDFANQAFGVNSGIANTEQACNFVLDYTTGPGGIGSFDPGLLYIVDTIGGGGGASGCVVNSTTSTSTTCTAGATSTGAANGSIPLINNGWQKPSWQTGVSGIPNDGVRDIPDVSFFASDGFLSSSSYLVCVAEASQDPECAYSTSSEPFASEVGGTSVATPAMAGVMALINQNAGASQGNPNAELYKLAAAQTYSNCSAERGNGSPVTSSNCLFNDIDSGTNAMPCDFIDGSPNCSTTQTTFGSTDEIAILPGYSAGAGYDQATGLGSLNVANVVKAWPATTGGGTAKVTVTPAESSLSSSNSLGVTVTVASSTSGGETPTGTVTLTASGTTYSSSVTSSSGSYSFTIPANTLPGNAAGEVDTLTASYAGDAQYGATTGTATVTVTTAVVGLLTPTVTVSPASSTVNSGASLSVPVTVSGSGGTPTGTVSLSGGGYSSGAQTLVNGAYTFTIPANTLSSGSDTLTATYSGDATYSSNTGTATVTVTESTFTLNMPAVAVTPSTIAPGASSAAVVTVAAVNGYTGTVTLTCQETSTTASSGGDGAQCSLGSGGGVTLSTSTMSGTVTFNVSTAAPISAALVYPKVRGKGNGWAGAGGGAVLAFLLFFGIPKRRRNWRQMLGALVLMTALGGLAGCGSTNGGGGGGQSDPGTLAGTYTFTVQATGSPSVTPAVSTTFTVTVN